MTLRRLSDRSRTTLPIACLAVLLAGCGEPTSPNAGPDEPSEIPVTGVAVPEMASYDRIIADLMETYDIPGGAVGVLHEGRLVYARGFGYADVENRTPVQPDAGFRIASVSKPITGVAVMKLVEEGKLGLDDRVAPYIAHLPAAEGATVDPRWEQITIRHLLNHTGGWDRNRPDGGFDPMFRPAVAAAAVGAPAPASAETVIRYMKGMPLDFAPGEKYAYSNFGYAILGRVIEHLSGMSYEDYVRTRVLRPAGAERTRLGGTRLSAALPGEVRYYIPGLAVNAPLVPSVFPSEGQAPLNYGGFYMEALDSHGGWVSSTVDLLRLMAALDGLDNRPDVLGADLIAEMTGSGVPLCPDGACYYAQGWLVRPVGESATWWHGGSLPGTSSLLVRSWKNVAWVALFNARAEFGDFPAELDAGMWDALAHAGSLPGHDLFPSFP